MKKAYIAPSVETIKILCDGLLTTASPGVGEFDPEKPVDAKRGVFYFDYESDESLWRGGEDIWLYNNRSLWDE